MPQVGPEPQTDCPKACLLTLQTVEFQWYCDGRMEDFIKEHVYFYL